MAGALETSNVFPNSSFTSSAVAVSGSAATSSSAVLRSSFILVSASAASITILSPSSTVAPIVTSSAGSCSFRVSSLISTSALGSTVMVIVAGVSTPSTVKETVLCSAVNTVPFAGETVILLVSKSANATSFVLLSLMVRLTVKPVRSSLSPTV